MTKIIGFEGSWSETMQIIPKIIDNIPVIAVSGRIDAATSKDLESALVDIMDRHTIKMVVDLKDVEYISSSGLRVLLAALKRLRQSQGDLFLTSLQPFVREVFEVTGFSKIFSIFPSQVEAVKGFQ